MDAYSILKAKIKQKSSEIGVIGLGYVGLPLAVEFAKKGFKVTGIDVSQKRVDELKKQKKSYILDVPSQDIRSLVEAGLLDPTTDFKKIKRLDVIIICVPTPLRKTREPDISYIVSAAEKVAGIHKSGRLIILESTTYPGTTEEILLPIFKRDGLKLDKDFFLTFSPERVDPGNPNFKTKDIPKIIGGVTKKSSMLASLLYSHIIETVKIVPSSRTAEMVKLLENTFRSVNIGLVNEITLMCHRMGIEVWDVIEAAGTKPFGFMPFYPGPGLGGHCIPIDPLYLSWKARLFGYEARFIDLADTVNSHMPQHVVRRVGDLLNRKRKPLMGSRVLIAGVAYKKDVGDTRESPALEIMNLLRKEGCSVSYFDPHVPRMKVDGKVIKSLKPDRDLYRNKDCVIIVADHSSMDYDRMLKESRLIFDTRNKFKGTRAKKVVKL